MKKAEETFLVLLRDTLHPGAAPSELPSQDWASVFDVARKQNLLPLLYDGAARYPSFEAFDAANPRYFAAATAAMTVQMQKTAKFLDLYKAFLSAGLRPITMKGIICRSLYGERGELRPSGDEDLLIEKQDYKKAVEILNRCGYRSEEQPDKALKAVQEVTFYDTNKEGASALVVELHLNPFGSASAARDKMNGWFQGVFQSDETVVVQNTPVRTMTPTDHFLFLVFHAFKHFTSGGLGVRMLLDTLLFAEKYGSRMDWKYLAKALNETGTSGFLSDLMEIGSVYLGFQFPQPCVSVSPQELLEDMFRTGTFGTATDADRTAGRIVDDTVQAETSSGRKYASYLRLLFPSWKTWTFWKPYLSDRPWMLPVEWCKRMARFLRGETSSGSFDEIEKSYVLAENRLTLLKKYGVL